MILDNAGGHGTKEAKQKYMQQLLVNDNIIMKWQPPRSPELRDLPIESINKVFTRIPVVCQLIVIDGGNNLRVEDQ